MTPTFETFRRTTLTESNTVHRGIGEQLLLVKWKAELLVGLQKLRVNFIQARLASLWAQRGS